MKTNIFELSNEELGKIADALEAKIEEGLGKDNMEILANPTHINPRKEIPDGTVLALDWGGTNFRAAIVEFKNGKPVKVEGPEEMVLDAKETDALTREGLYGKMAETIKKLKTFQTPPKNEDDKMAIGYCFSYATASRLNGDAILLHMSKGMEFPDMIDQPVGKPLLDYLNVYEGLKGRFSDIKVINDTVACLFAGLENAGYDSYIGLIVGTGNNMAAQMRLDKIPKLNNKSNGAIPINLESGNFNPPYLTVVDGLVDAMSNNKGKQRFEKAISGAYLGEIFKTYFMCEKIAHDFNGASLAEIFNHPDKYPTDQAQVAGWIYQRSARLVAAALVGLAQVIVKQDSAVKNIGVAVEGSVFWGEGAKGGYPYRDIVVKQLEELKLRGVKITILDRMKGHPNLTGAAIAALSPSGKIVYD